VLLLVVLLLLLLLLLLQIMSLIGVLLAQRCVKLRDITSAAAV
jgi:hypothetical protein